MIEVDALAAPDGRRRRRPSLRRRRPDGHRLRRLPITLYLGGALVTAFVAVALLSFVWTPYPPNELHMTNRLAPPGTPGFLLGTDRAGRDVVTELMLGARNSLYVSVVSTIVALITGAVIGLAIAGTAGSVRGPLTRLVDAGLALPGILTGSFFFFAAPRRNGQRPRTETRLAMARPIAPVISALVKLHADVQGVPRAEHRLNSKHHARPDRSPVGSRVYRGRESVREVQLVRRIWGRTNDSRATATNAVTHRATEVQRD